MPMHIGYKGEEGRMESSKRKQKKTGNHYFSKRETGLAHCFLQTSISAYRKAVRSWNLSGFSVHICDVFLLFQLLLELNQSQSPYLFLLHAVCLILSQVVPVLYRVLNQSCGCWHCFQIATNIFRVFELSSLCDIVYHATCFTG